MYPHGYPQIDAATPSRRPQSAGAADAKSYGLVARKCPARLSAWWQPLARHPLPRCSICGCESAAPGACYWIGSARLRSRPPGQKCKIVRILHRQARQPVTHGQAGRFRCPPLAHARHRQITGQKTPAPLEARARHRRTARNPAHFSAGWRIFPPILLRDAALERVVG